MKIDSIATRSETDLKTNYTLSGEVALEILQNGGAKESIVAKIKELQVDYGFSEEVALEIYKLSLRKGE